MEFKRTDEDITFQLPIKIRLGEVVYDVKPLRMNKAVAWRTMFHQELSPIINSLDNAVSATMVNDSLVKALMQFPEKLVKLVYAYAPELEAAKEAIEHDETGATEEQFAKAFSMIMVVAYPFLADLRTVTAALRLAR